jgi:hypothetical protein
MFWGIKLMSGLRVRRRLLHVALFVVWVAVIVTGIITCVAQVLNFRWSNDAIVETRQISTSDTLRLALAPTTLQISNNPIVGEAYFDKDNRCFYGKPNLYVRKSDDGQTRLKFYRKSQGENKRAAYQYAETIEYAVDVSNSLLTFDQFFTVTPQDKWKFQTLSITLYAPEGTVITTDNNGVIGRWFGWSRNEKGIWIMTENNGLQRVE